MSYKQDNVILYRGVEDLQVNILNHNDSKITFEVINTPIHAFDQHARARVGHKFFDYKISDDPIYTFYTATYDRLLTDPNKVNEFIELAKDVEIQRNKTDFKYPYNLMSRNTSYKVEVEYSALIGQMSRRLKFCEEETITGIFFLLRQKMIDKGIKFANDYLPGCDKTGKCDYIDVSDHLSSVFNALFSACGRHKTDENTYRSFNQSCTTPGLLIKQLHIDIPKSKWEIEQNIQYI